MTKEELFKMMNEHPVMYVATNENGQPHVRAILRRQVSYLLWPVAGHYPFLQTWYSKDSCDW